MNRKNSKFWGKILSVCQPSVKKTLSSSWEPLKKSSSFQRLLNGHPLSSATNLSLKCYYQTAFGYPDVSPRKSPVENPWQQRKTTNKTSTLPRSIKDTRSIFWNFLLDNFNVQSFRHKDVFMKKLYLLSPLANDKSV